MLLPKFIDRFLISLLSKKGYVRSRSTDAPAIARRMQLLGSQSIDLVIDIGANTGQYALQIREAGYKNRIISFEPMKSAYNKLKLNTQENIGWECFQLGLGHVSEEKLINISENSISSSLLKMENRHKENAPDSVYISQETIRVSTLDEQFKKFYKGEKNIWLKIDVQGYENFVLQGSKKTLAMCKIVQMEISLVSLYEGQATFVELINMMENFGFDFIGVEAGFQELNSGILLQVDGIFKNRLLINE